jgi:hypothetical protein
MNKKINSGAFWNLTLSSPVCYSYQNFGGICYLNFQDRYHLSPENWGGTFFRNIGNNL